MVALWRGGVSTLQRLQLDFLAPALRSAALPSECVDRSAARADAPRGDKRAVGSVAALGGAAQIAAAARHGARKRRNVYVALGEPNTRRELAMAASEAETATLVTSGELAWGLHREPELRSTPTAYTLLLRDPVSRLLSDYATYRGDRFAGHPLHASARDGLRAFSKKTANYALRFLGNDTRTCRPRRSPCASLAAFHESMRAEAAAIDAPDLGALAAPRAENGCHLDYAAEERRLLECAFSDAKSDAVLRGNLAYLKGEMHRLFFAVGLLERLPETLVLWRLAARGADAGAWPLPPCVPPPPPPSPPASLSLTADDVDAIRRDHALDIDLYDTVRGAFQLQLLSAARHGGPEVKDLLARAKNGSLPQCAR